MSMIKKIFPHKVMFVCTAITLIACGGASTKSDTPSIADLQTLADNITAQSLVVAPVSNPLNPADPTDIASTNDIASASATAAALAEGAPEGTFIDAGLPGIADIFIGTVDVPYYFDTANSTTSFWLPTLDVRETLTVPLMMTMPNANSGQVMPDSGWPIAIYQHGITRNRTDVIAYADSLASVGFAVIAIDLPTHGLPFTEIEQTYGQNETSGENFINLASLLTSRDNLRQGSANLLTLRRLLHTH